MELNRIFKYRNIWIGAAMLWIIFFHAGFWMEESGLKTFKELGYGGVDLCLFASGIGCYYSLEKDPDILRFLKRRIRRLGPAYICFIVPWLLWYHWTKEMPAGAVLGNILGIQTLVSWQYHFNWYIGGLVVFYLCLPYLKQLTDSCGKLWQDILAGLLLAAVSIPFWKDPGNDIIILTRLPVLYAGVVCAKLAKQGYRLRKRDYLLQLIAVAAGVKLILVFKSYYPDTLWNCGLYWYPFLLIAPGACLYLSLLAEQLEKWRFLRWLNGFLQIIGVYSFEIYLVHVFLYEGLMADMMERFYCIPNNLLWMLTFPVIVGGTFLLNRAAACLSRVLEKHWIKTKA